MDVPKIPPGEREKPASQLGQFRPQDSPNQDLKPDDFPLVGYSVLALQALQQA